MGGKRRGNEEGRALHFFFLIAHPQSKEGVALSVSNGAWGWARKERGREVGARVRGDECAQIEG